mmetsp:Transcript_41379/g.46207  ORF Transcript_41379/g.46207 Transcript_41379/m.46207 type:complete len:86 (-) Transcript_41379:323-580(-)
MSTDAKHQFESSLNVVVKISLPKSLRQESTCCQCISIKRQQTTDHEINRNRFVIDLLVYRYFITAVIAADHYNRKLVVFLKKIHF